MRGRVLAALLACASLSFSSGPAASQSGASGGWDTTPSSIPAAIASTISQHLRRRLMDGMEPQVLQGINAAYPLLAPGTQKMVMEWVALLARNTDWSPLSLFFGYPKTCEPGNLTPLCTQWMGGGVTGSWDPDCQKLKMRFDAAGFPMLPSIPLAPGTPLNPTLTPATWRVYTSTSSSVLGASAYERASTADAAVLRSLHRWNSALSTYQDQRDWESVMKIENGYYTTVRAAFFNDAGVLQQRRVRGTSTESSRTPDSSLFSHWNYYSSTRNPRSKDCPPANMGATDVHFYSGTSANTDLSDSHRQQDLCTIYIPNYSLSKSGYAYPDYVSVGMTEAELTSYINSNPLFKSCPLSPEFLRKLADAVWKAETLKAGYTGPAYQPITIDDVRTGGQSPRGEDLLGKTPKSTDPAPVSTPEPPKPEAGTPPPMYTPPSTPSTSGTLPDFTSPGVTGPDITAPEFSMPDWFPGLSALSIPLGSGECPTYQFDAFEVTYTLDSHCPLIEMNRAAISAIMLVCFAIGAALVVMRA